MRILEILFNTDCYIYVLFEQEGYTPEELDQVLLRYYQLPLWKKIKLKIDLL